MARRSLLTARTRQELFGIPEDPKQLTRFYTLSRNDHGLIRTRRRDENRLGLAIHIALLRHPGQGWLDGSVLPESFIMWLADQLAMPGIDLVEYTRRRKTKSEHHQIAMSHLGLRPFQAAHLETATLLAREAAFATDHGQDIMTALCTGLRKQRLVLPSTDTLERVALKGRAAARRQAAAGIFDVLSADHRTSLQNLLINDHEVGQSRLTWLRGYPHSTSPASMHALLARIRYVRELNLPPDLGQDIHPMRLTKFAREGAVAPLSLLNDFGERRRIATVAAQLLDLQVMLTDAAISMFERLTGQLFTRSKNKQDQVWAMGKARVGRLMQLFGNTIDTMALAHEAGTDPFEALDGEIGWQRLLQHRDEIAAFGELATGDPLELATERYAYMRKFAPAFLDTFTFSAPEAGRDLQEAVNLLRDHNKSGKRKLPADAPMPFPAKHWPKLIVEGGQPKRRVYETAVVATLRDRLRAGDVWVEGSQDYRRFDSYLIPRETAEAELRKQGLETDADAWLQDRRHVLNLRLSEIEHKLKRGQLDGVRLEKGRLRITPHEADTPPEAIRLERAMDAIMPRIRITDLLWEVNTHTGFLDAFTDLRSGRNHEDPAVLLATILAGASNLGLERMAYASKHVSHSQLTWGSMWYLRPETYVDSLARIVDAHHDLPFAGHWGEVGNTSSDGQFFAANRGSGLINAKYGPDPGLKIYSFLSGRYGSFHSSVIGATAGEAPFVLDGLVGNPMLLNPLIHYTDTGGVSDHVFALFHLLGMKFAPRLRDFPDRKLACFGSPRQWPFLAPLMGSPIKDDVIVQHWGDAIRLAGSAKTKAIKPSATLRKLGGYRQQNRLYLALGEIGRIERTLFMLDWLENPELRRDCQAGLNKGEARHTLAKAVFAHSQGRIYDRSDAAQQKRAMALNMVIAAIMFWNTLYMDKASAHLARQGQIPNPKLLCHTSPLGWEHIILTGDYDWHSGAAERKIARPLHLNATRKWVG
ncbi:MAG: transposase [Thalassobium sp.]|nr:MAG: transposase [Thalassobium sp.]